MAGQFIKLATRNLDRLPARMCVLQVDCYDCANRIERFYLCGDTLQQRNQARRGRFLWSFDRSLQPCKRAVAKDLVRIIPPIVGIPSEATTWGHFIHVPSGKRQNVPRRPGRKPEWFRGARICSGAGDDPHRYGQHWVHGTRQDTGSLRCGMIPH